MTYWYQYPSDSPGGGYQEIIDPMGNYLKPDTNIAVPSGTPITTWDSGTITSVVDRGRSLAGLSVTEKLDNPVNNQAQYASFNYLGSATVAPGQRVQAGQQLGVAGSPYGVNFALALGTSPVWGSQCPQCTSKQPNLDPRIVLRALNNGTLPEGGTPTSSGTDLSSLPFGLGGVVTGLQGSIVNFTEETGIFIIALVLIILGVMILASKQIREGIHTGVKAGEVGLLA